MKIRFVLCHLDVDLAVEQRQLNLGDMLLSSGHDVAVYGVSSDPAPASAAAPKRHGAYATPVLLFPRDDPEANLHATTSDAMLAALAEDAPDLILLKGVDYKQAERIAAQFPTARLGAIIGGVSSHPLLDRCGLIYFETELQRAAYVGPARTYLLPKMIPWRYVLPHGLEGVDFDIINVGNFDEDRKAQELLLPFTLDLRVLFVGSGRRLKAFQTICAQRPNVSFTGYIEQAELFALLSRSHLMVHTSIWEGYPRAVAESLAAGVPVVGLKGVLDGVPVDDALTCVPVEDLYSTVRDWLADPHRLATLGQSGQRQMRETSSDNAMMTLFRDTVISHVEEARRLVG